MAKQKLAFTKMHGLGNDFIVLNNLDGSIQLNREQIQFLSHRNFGIGFDQLLLVEQAENSNMDFKYRIFNADGNEVEQCGNGARCFAYYVNQKGLSSKQELHVETMKGNIVLYLEQDRVRVNMGQADFSPLALPMDVQYTKVIEANHYQIVRNIQENEEKIDFAVVSVGNPHMTIQVEDVDNFPVTHWGEVLVKDNAFPQGVNVGFVQIVNPSLIKLRVFERGVGETLACGTGACASVVNGIEKGILNQKVEVQLLGGSLSISWHGKEESIWMTGPASLVYEGIIDL